MKLIILNGPTGVGKSTVAAALHAQMPTSVLVDVDELRRSIPDYREKKEESLRLAYDYAVEAIEAALKEEKDVIIDKTIADTDVLDRFSASAQSHGADIYEFLLFTDKESLLKRADARGYRPGSLLTREKVGEHWDRADTLRSQRQNAIVIDTTNVDSDGVVTAVLHSLHAGA